VYGSGTLCSDICGTNNDGVCDDGGPDSDTDFCNYGSDCHDCGRRDTSICVCPADAECGKNPCGDPCGRGCDADALCSTRSNRCVPEREGCTDECIYSGDGVCDDGMSGSLTAYCREGTDCGDCGAR
jgi:hypothetical protein